MCARSATQTKRAGALAPSNESGSSANLTKHTLSAQLLAEMADGGLGSVSLLSLYTDAIVAAAHAGQPLRASQLLSDARMDKLQGASEVGHVASPGRV